jgi:hypothetical protein
MVRPVCLLWVSGACLAMAVVLAAMIISDLVPGQSWLGELQEKGQTTRVQPKDLRGASEWVRVQ